MTTEETRIIETLPNHVPRILVVDDDEQVIRGLKRTLRATGWEIISVNSAAEAISVLENTKDISVILSDQNMPSSTGVELLAYAHDRFPTLVKVMITGGTDIKATISAINQGHVFRYLTKPWDKDELIGALRAAINLYEVRRDRDHFQSQVREKNKELESLNRRLEETVQKRTAEVIDLYGRLEKSFDATIDALLSILELNSPICVQHTKRTAVRVRRVGRNVGLTDDEVHIVERASLLHWLGLTRVPVEFFSKDLHEIGPDLEATWEFHPILGAQALQAIPALEKERLVISHYLNPDSCEREFERHLAHVLLACSMFEHAANVRRRNGRPLDMAVLAEILELFESHFSHISQDVVDTLFDTTADELGAKEKEIHAPDELKTGMVLAEDVDSIDGIPLIPAGVRIDEEVLERLQTTEVEGAVSVWKTEDTR